MLTNALKKQKIDTIVKYIFMILTIFCAFQIIYIVLFIAIKGFTPFFRSYTLENGNIIHVNLFEMISSVSWNQDMADFGLLGIITNTIYITLISSLIALFISVLTALFIVRIAPKWIGIILNNVVELLASIPSIIFGLFGMGVINPMVSNIAFTLGIQTKGGMSVLSVIIVLVIMMIPTITMITITSMKTVKKSLIEASLALGASKSQTDFKIVINSSKSGIITAFILGVGRALGEATAVSMVCGNAITGPNLNLFDTTRTLTSTMMLGLHEATGVNYDIRFTVGIVLILIILGTNLLLNKVKRRIS